MMMTHDDTFCFLKTLVYKRKSQAKIEKENNIGYFKIPGGHYSLLHIIPWKTLFRKALYDSMLVTQGPFWGN